MKKKLIIAAVFSVLCLSCVSCGGDNSGSDQSQSTTSYSAVTDQNANSKSDSSYVPISVEGQTPNSTGYINPPGTKEFVMVMNQPSDQGYMNGSLFAGDEVEIYGRESNWLLIKSGDITGYVEDENISSEKP